MSQDMEMEIKRNLLDKLMSEMDEFSVKGSREKPEGQMVAAVEEKTILPGEDSQKRMKEAPVYLNPKRQEVLDQVEEQSPHGEGEFPPAGDEHASMQENDDYVLSKRFNNFGKSKRG